MSDRPRGEGVAAAARACLGRARGLSPTWRFVLLTWAASRAFFLVTGAVGAAYAPRAEAGVVPEPPGALSYWAHWDGAWYAQIATEGYAGPASTAFFPLYPLAIRPGLAVGVGPALAGVVVSSVAFLFALFFVYRVALELWDERVARAASLALAFFPTALFFNAVYAEAVFLALAAGAVWAVYVRGDFALAGYFAYGAALSRNVGVFLVVPAAVEWLRRRRQVGWSGAIGVLGAPAGFVAYLVYVDRVTRSPLTFALEQKYTWGRELTDPITTLTRSIRAAGRGAEYLVHPWRVFAGAGVNASYDLSNVLNLGCFFLLVPLLVGAFLRLPLGLSLYCLAASAAAVLTPASFLPFTGLSRYMLGAFPLFFVLGTLLSRSWFVLAPWLVASGILGGFLAVLFTSWRWVG